MKKSKIIVPALAMLVMSTAATVTGTVAWFSMNKTVTASGMVVKAQAEGSLVIKNREKNNPTLPAASLRATDYNFNDTAGTSIYASTHDATYGTGLKYVTNAEVINPETGTRNDDGVAELAYAVAENVTDGKQYYKDYEVYIAGDGQAFNDRQIKVSITATAGDSNAVNKAVSVDFYALNVNSPQTTIFSASNYINTLNVAGTKNNGTNQPTEFTSFNISKNVPQANGSGALAVLMRVYYDGALIEKGGSGYTNYAQYVDIEDGEAPVSGTYYYTSDHKVSLVAEGSTTAAQIAGLCKVDTTKSVVTYASSNEYGSLADVQLKATFELI